MYFYFPHQKDFREVKTFQLKTCMMYCHYFLIQNLVPRNISQPHLKNSNFKQI